ncbi:MAG: hypothetical protein QXT81_04160 [Candidatus Bathyarchaeia archaeon]
MASQERQQTCSVCGQVTEEDGLCRLHHLAKEKLTRGYELWKVAYGSLDYVDYLRLLIALPETGEAAAAVARHMLQEEEGGNGEDANHMREA